MTLVIEEVARPRALGVTAWACVPGEHRRVADADVEFGSLLWLEIEPIASPADVVEAFGTRCRGLTLGAARDLLDRDSCADWRRHENGLRSVSAVGVIASTEGDERAELIFDNVEFLAGEDWLMTCWHKSELHRGTDEIIDTERIARGEIVDAVGTRWAAGEGSSAGDIGILVLHELALKYSKARHRLYQAITDCELDFFDSPVNGIECLARIRRLLAEFHKQLDGLNVPREKAREVWFSGVTLTSVAERVDDLIDRSVRDVRDLTDELRMSIDLLQSKQLSEQLARAGEENDRNTRFQRKVELLGSIVLVPTLIAGIYGANTHLPGATPKSMNGFDLLVILMVVGAAGMFLALQLLGRFAGGAKNT